jgi:phage terminase small subunit
MRSTKELKELKNILITKGLFENIDETMFQMLTDVYTLYLESYKIVKKEGAITIVKDYHGREKQVQSIAFVNMITLQKQLKTILDSLHCSPKSRKSLEKIDTEENPIEKMLRELNEIEK